MAVDQKLRTFSERVLDWASGKKPSAIAELLSARLSTIVFQPIVDLQTREVFAYEALARSLSPHFKSPLEMFASAVSEGRVGELGRLLRMLAVDGCTSHPLFLNVNPNEFDEGWLVRPDDPFFWHEQPVFMEITESVPLNRFDQCKSVIAEMRAKGVGLVVDDLGAGFSNLKYISDLEPDMVKIDRDLISGLTQNSRGQKLVRSIVSLCRDLGSKVVAEGIETHDEFLAVCDAGVDYGQGYLLAYPESPPPKVNWPK